MHLSGGRHFEFLEKNYTVVFRVHLVSTMQNFMKILQSLKNFIRHFVSAILIFLNIISNS